MSAQIAKDLGMAPVGSFDEHLKKSTSYLVIRLALKKWKNVQAFVRKANAMASEFLNFLMLCKERDIFYVTLVAALPQIAANGAGKPKPQSSRCCRYWSCQWYSQDVGHVIPKRYQYNGNPTGQFEYYASANILLNTV
ncbi:hypothetical protein EVAR_101092_1 [Eumeta japonica]|uniref:Uncharacterized protein n=1 Tax=Eumeta variegata TaxID=151549 RepID=A0A4C1T063_EUMVA|nr:hypothetical protein EVAR_101092_1 [Eumeta japonica]